MHLVKIEPVKIEPCTVPRGSAICTVPKYRRPPTTRRRPPRQAPHGKPLSPSSFDAWAYRQRHRVTRDGAWKAAVTEQVPDDVRTRSYSEWPAGIMLTSSSVRRHDAHRSDTAACQTVLSRSRRNLLARSTHGGRRRDNSAVLSTECGTSPADALACSAQASTGGAFSRATVALASCYTRATCRARQEAPLSSTT